MGQAGRDWQHLGLPLYRGRSWGSCRLSGAVFDFSAGRLPERAGIRDQLFLASGQDDLLACRMVCKLQTALHASRGDGLYQTRPHS